MSITVTKIERAADHVDARHQRFGRGEVARDGETVTVPMMCADAVQRAVAADAPRRSIPLPSRSGTFSDAQRAKHEARLAAHRANVSAAWRSSGPSTATDAALSSPDRAASLPTGSPSASGGRSAPFNARDQYVARVADSWRRP